MSNLKTLGKTTWDKIKVGEVFANNGCWEILYKQDEHTIILLADDYSKYSYVSPLGSSETYYPDKVYKLPKSVQRLWKVE